MSPLETEAQNLASAETEIAEVEARLTNARLWVARLAAQSEDREEARRIVGELEAAMVDLIVQRDEIIRRIDRIPHS